MLPTTYIHTHTPQPQHTNHQVLLKQHLGERVNLLQERLRVGWGTARVAVGMAFTAHVYEYCKYGSQVRCPFPWDLFIVCVGRWV